MIGLPNNICFLLWLKQYTQPLYNTRQNYFCSNLTSSKKLFFRLDSFLLRGYNFSFLIPGLFEGILIFNKINPSHLKIICIRRVLINGSKHKPVKREDHLSLTNEQPLY